MAVIEWAIGALIRWQITRDAMTWRARELETKEKSRG